jgi:hypothetical protein
MVIVAGAYHCGQSHSLSSVRDPSSSGFLEISANKAAASRVSSADKGSEVVADPETTAALDFHNQLSTTQLLLGIEIGDASFRLEQLQDFMESNY